MAGDLLAESVRKLSPRQLAWLEAHAPAEDMELIRVALIRARISGGGRTRRRWRTG